MVFYTLRNQLIVVFYFFMKNEKRIAIYEVHKIKAIEHFLMAEKAINHEVNPLYEQMVMNCHMGVEMIMKAAIYKFGGIPPTHGPEGHNLLKIASTKIGKRKLLLDAINSTGFIQPLWHKIVSAWNINKRYEFMGLSPLDYDDLYEAYERFYRWIVAKFVD
ncbi:MAG: hypothetical protein A2381_03415 [Bdellovibrionales bacterium RIFOXYB1_FULL_37_110]|nr:MAG: hypothetical protein A2181_00520 [Bdellovibrionales bacterium RIFOXYA1_FULL_38_20]OFZ48454.1 MAG: hypothetical protein A2417_03905 [Bdellovibrionales bacterium RIFOXYC1_FULL_37_79]OFZ57975.1 MAG: hypothetical protein A2381_03415 [Bdellovibrionales bacterium RIFOXYB1_FULL_37_110]OFZ63112.1 MAG: hypothetical protein A2577_15545 [Bdellovibrionales bacterium RIFOXYD1_FULL_36_51]